MLDRTEQPHLVSEWEYSTVRGAMSGQLESSPLRIYPFCDKHGTGVMLAAAGLSAFWNA